MLMPGVRVGEQPRDPRVDEIVRAVQVEGLGVLRLHRLADVRAHRIDVDAVAGSRAGRMQEKRLLKHTAAAQRTLKTAARVLVTSAGCLSRASRTLFRKSGSSRVGSRRLEPFRISIDSRAFFLSTPRLTDLHFTNNKHFCSFFCSKPGMSNPQPFKDFTF